MKTEQLLPKNIRQIGSPVGHTKVYIEDYVITFLNSLSMDKNTYVRGAILFGEKKTIEDDTIIYVKGAIEGQNLELDLDETVFNDEVWREIYQQKDRLFPGLEVIGWALLRMGFSVRLNDKIKKTHFENFPGEGKVLYMIDDLENEDAFYVYRGQDLARQSGYYIYYDKNPMMQEYLAERREGMKESENYEKMMENMRDERLIRQFREKVSRKTKTVTKVLDTQASTVEKKSTTAAQITTAKKTAATAAKKTNASKYKYYKYTVKKGETLVSISRKVYGTQKLVKRIREANALSNQNQIYPGQKLIIPIAR